MNEFARSGNAGVWKLLTTQVNKMIRWSSANGIFLVDAKVDFYNVNDLVHTYSMGNGLELTDGVNQADQDKTVTLTMQGSDFSQYKGRTLRAKGYFFNTGDVAVVFDLEIG